MLQAPWLLFIPCFFPLSWPVLANYVWFYKLCSWTHMDVWHITSRAQWNDLALPSFFFYLSRQAVETNLASKDSHWVYANEVSLNNTFLFLLLFIHISNHFWPLLISNVLRYTLYLSRIDHIFTIISWEKAKKKFYFNFMGNSVLNAMLLNVCYCLKYKEKHKCQNLQKTVEWCAVDEIHKFKIRIFFFTTQNFTGDILCPLFIN